MGLLKVADTHLGVFRNKCKFLVWPSPSETETLGVRPRELCVNRPS